MVKLILQRGAASRTVVITEPPYPQAGDTCTTKSGEWTVVATRLVPTRERAAGEITAKARRVGES